GSAGLVRSAVPATTTHPLNQGRCRAKLGDQKIGIKIERHLANLGRDGENGLSLPRLPSPLEGLHDVVMPRLSINKTITAVIAENGDPLISHQLVRFRV